MSEKKEGYFPEFLHEALLDERSTLKAVRGVGADRHVLELITEAMDKLDAAAYWLRRGKQDAEEDGGEGRGEGEDGGEEAVADV